MDNERPLRIILNRELSKRQEYLPRAIPGEDVVRLAAAIGVPDIRRKKGLGLGTVSGDGADDADDVNMKELLLRHGHGPKTTRLMLTCTDSRRQMTANQDLDVLADHLQDSGTPQGRPALLEVMFACDGLAQRADPDWLKSRVHDQHWLAVALELGQHYARLKPAWLVRNLDTDEALSYALTAGRYIQNRRVNAHWLAENVADRSVLLHLLKQLGERVSPDWIASQFPKFPDFVDAACSPMCSTPLTTEDDLFAMYDAHYRKDTPSDLAAGVLVFLFAQARDIDIRLSVLFKELRGCVVEDVVSIFETVKPSEENIANFVVDFVEGVSLRSACCRAIAHHGWSSEDACELSVSLVPDDFEI